MTHWPTHVFMLPLGNRFHGREIHVSRPILDDRRNRTVDRRKPVDVDKTLR